MAREKMNPLCPCRKTGAWDTKAKAERALARVLLAEDDGTRMYRPVCVVQCPHDVWHLTSRIPKLWRSGKTPQRRRKSKRKAKR